MASIFSSRILIFSFAFLLRLVLLIYGIYQDSISALKYTDIDYFVFTDAARAISRHQSPYSRATYRYTPILAWILLPTTWGGLWFHFGKVLFALSDLIAGWLILILLQRKGLDRTRSLKYASIWLLNPMVANISTRGSSEGLLCALIMGLVWSFETRKIILSGLLLGFCVHFKIYPFIYATTLVWVLDETTTTTPSSSRSVFQRITHFVNPNRIRLAITSIITFTILNATMYKMYGMDFLNHTFLHHLTRLDHRHNFSPYNTLLYLSSTKSKISGISSIESKAFIPQILLSLIFIPISLKKSKYHTTLFAQTICFVTFNKVCTSQYFLWYLIFLPLYLPNSSLTTSPQKGIIILSLWIGSQALWLQQAYNLEFLGKNTFVPGLWLSSLILFLVNCWILGIVISDGLIDDDVVVIQTVPGTGIDNNGKTKKVQTRDEKLIDEKRIEDRKASVSGTSIGLAHLGPRNRVLKSQ